MHIDLILEPDLRPEQICELGLLAESYGFRGVWTQNYSSARDALMSLVPLAQKSSSILLGAVIFCPYEMHPIKLANAALTLDEYASGRSMIVVGSGGEWPEVMMSDVFKSSYQERMANVRETLEILKEIKTTKACNYHGLHYSAIRFSAGWHQESGPLVYHGACGPKMLAMGRQIADGCMMSDVMPEMLAKRMKALESRESFGEHFRISNFIAWHVREDKAESHAEARRELIIRGWLERDWLEPYLDETDTNWVLENRWPFLQAWLQKTGSIAGAPDHIVSTLLEKLSLAGDHRDIDRHIGRLKIFEHSGFSEIALRIHERPDESIRLIGREVIPEFDRWHGSGELSA